MLNSIARALNRSADLDAALGVVLEQVAQLLGLETGWVWLTSETSGEPYLAAAQNLPPGLAGDPRRMDGSSYCYCLDTYRKGDLAGAANVSVVACSRLAGLVDGAEGLRYHFSVPLYAPGGKRLGVMNLAASEWRGLSAKELPLLHTVGELLSIAVERARLFESSVRLAALEERNRLAREIHDTLAQGLAATGLQLEAAEALLEADEGSYQARENVRRALFLTRTIQNEARNSATDLQAAAEYS